MREAAARAAEQRRLMAEAAQLVAFLEQLSYAEEISNELHDIGNALRSICCARRLL